MTSIETYQETSGNLVRKNGSQSANASFEITDKMKEILQEHIDLTEEKSKTEHFLQMSTLRTVRGCQDSEMSDVRSKINTLTRVLTTLTHKMVGSSSERRGGGYRGRGGYTTVEDIDSDKENNHHTNTRGRNQPKRKWKYEKPKKQF